MVAVRLLALKVFNDRLLVIAVKDVADDAERRKSTIRRKSTGRKTKP